jgi:hypothetical protein
VTQDQTQVKAEDSLNEIESMYLQFSFNEMPFDSMVKVKGVMVSSAITPMEHSHQP